MKMAFIYDAVYPWIKGGAEKRIYEIGKRLAKKHEVHLYRVGWWNGALTMTGNSIIDLYEKSPTKAKTNQS